MQTNANSGRGQVVGGPTLLPLTLLAACILLAMAVRTPGQRAETARHYQAAAETKVLAAAVRRYHQRHSRLPTLLQLAQPDVDGVREFEELPQDPWHRDYVLQPGTRPRDFVVISRGPNGTLGDDDDIRSSDPPR